MAARDRPVPASPPGRAGGGEGSSDLTGSVILACEMIEDEVRLALERLAPESRPPVIWVESGLHDRPERLRLALQELIDLLDEGALADSPVVLPSVRPGQGAPDERREEVVLQDPVHEVILALGFCGKGLEGLRSRQLRMVFPRVDDCISLFLNHGCTREKIPRDSRSYYLTRGWFSHNSSVSQEFEDWVNRFGAERAASLRKAMFQGYERVSLIDTQAYDVAECVDRSQAYADDLELEHVIVPGSIQLLERMFAGDRGSEIVVIPPGEAIGFLHLFTSKDA